MQDKETKMKTSRVFIGSLVVMVLAAASVRANQMRVYSTPAYDGAVQIGGTGVQGNRI